MTTLYVRDTSGFREAQASDVLDRAQAILAQRFRVGSPVLSSPALTQEFLRVHLGSLDYEIFGLLHLDTRNMLLAVENLFRGTLNSAAVHPRRSGQDRSSAQFRLCDPVSQPRILRGHGAERGG